MAGEYTCGVLAIGILVSLDPIETQVTLCQHVTWTAISLFAYMRPLALPSHLTRPSISTGWPPNVMVTSQGPT